MSQDHASYLIFDNAPFCWHFHSLKITQYIEKLFMEGKTTAIFLSYYAFSGLLF